MNQSLPRQNIKATFCVMAIVLLSLCNTGNLYAERIVFFTPTSANNTYWPQVFGIVNKVAKDLDFQIDIHEFDVNNRFAKHIEGSEILQQQPKPDGAVFSVAFGNAKPLLELTEQLQIPVFIQGPLFPSELPPLGDRPRKLFSQWIGYFFQDEYRKGYLLARTLLDKVHAKKPHDDDSKIYVAGIGGDITWFGSKLRQDGLLKAVEEDPQAVLLQVVPTQWTEEEAMQKTQLLFHRYNHIDVVWAASDQLGIGAASAIRQKHGQAAEPKTLTGGLDLSTNGLQHVKDELLAATVAATMIQYAEVFIYLYDYLHGIDFANELSTELSAPLHIATKENADQYLQLLDGMNTIDFKPYSKHLNPHLKEYDFSIERLMDSINN